MSTDIVKGMGKEFARVLFSSKYFATDAERHEAAMRAALLFFADRIEENGDAVTGCKLAAVSAYLSKGQDGRGVVEPARLMKAISAALRAAGDGR